MEQPVSPRHPAQLGWGVWGTPRVGGVHGGVKRAEWLHTAGAGRRWVGRCAPLGAAVHGGSTHTHTPLIVSACARVDTAIWGCAQTLSGTRTEQHGVVTLTAAQHTGMGHEPPGWGQCRAGAQLCSWHCCCSSATLVERGARLVGTERNEASARARWK